MEKIGTGEGAQAYGHGLYFAENPEVARSYQLMGQPAYRGPYVRSLAQSAMKEAQDAGLSGADARQRAIQILHERAQHPNLPTTARQHLNDAANNFDAVISPPTGRTYRVEIDAEPHQFLDWDKPLSEQSPEVQKAITQLTGRGIDAGAEQRLVDLVVSRRGRRWVVKDSYGEYGTYGTQEAAQSRRYDLAQARTLGRQPGRLVYEMLGFKSQKDASDALNRVGIKGIRYLDQGSRLNTQGWRILAPNESVSGKWVVGNAPNGPNRYFDTEGAAREFYNAKVKQVTHNYVVFDDKIIKILESGLSGTALMSALTAAGVGATLAARLVAQNKKEQ